MITCSLPIRRCPTLSEWPPNLSRPHLVQLGILGQIGCLYTVDGTCYPRGSRVVCRTSRGLEVGRVLNPELGENGRPSDGVLLRRVTIEDDLLLARLEKNRDEAYQACARLLRERQLPALLLDVEQLFDGKSLYFYFLGETPPEVASITDELAATYEATVQIRKFAETLTQGCGPGCGTAEAAAGGCGSGGCSTCAVASACSKHE